MSAAIHGRVTRVCSPFDPYHMRALAPSLPALTVGVENYAMCAPPAFLTTTVDNKLQWFERTSPWPLTPTSCPSTPGTPECSHQISPLPVTSPFSPSTDMAVDLGDIKVDPDTYNKTGGCICWLFQQRTACTCTECFSGVPKLLIRNIRRSNAVTLDDPFTVLYVQGYTQVCLAWELPRDWPCNRGCYAEYTIKVHYTDTKIQYGQALARKAVDPDVLNLPRPEICAKLTSWSCDYIWQHQPDTESANSIAVIKEPHCDRVIKRLLSVAFDRNPAYEKLCADYAKHNKQQQADYAILHMTCRLFDGSSAKRIVRRSHNCIHIRLFGRHGNQRMQLSKVVPMQ